eukprot:TRINITY_DN23_c0_g1_i3.p3 TRINITY_DN23_c0_g1~~TRINITY_DN23_c0_g1_i3.p3  ORF type:complete len:217 (+),score=96.00 TRINITY_DN23_c0_g1_i3:1245-1895(+)
MQREEEKIQAYAERKERMLMLRKNKEDEVFQAKQAARNAMIAAQAERLSQMQNDEDARIEGQVRAKEEENEKKRLEKEALRRRFEAEMLHSRKVQIERKRNERQQEKAEDMETAAFLGEWCKVLDKQEAEEVELKKQAARKLADEHKKMVDVQRTRKLGEKKGEETVSLRAKKAMEADTIEFHNYAENVIRGYCEEGKNVIPLIKELREFRKRVLE